MVLDAIDNPSVNNSIYPVVDYLVNKYQYMYKVKSYLRCYFFVKELDRRTPRKEITILIKIRRIQYRYY
jgi:hypothetical protein